MNPKTIIQITDMHLFEHVDKTLLGVNTYDSYTAVVENIQNNYPNPDMILLTGDLAQDETTGAYQLLIDALDIFHCPKYGFPGNHDDESHMLAAFKENHLQDNREIIINGWNFILLNTQKKHAVEGFLNEEQLMFLDHSLGAYPEHPTMIFMHHPPVPVGSEWIDKYMLSNDGPFWDILSNYHAIKAIVCGHVHQDFACTHRGIDVYTTPSTCFQFATKSPSFKLERIMPGYRAIIIDEQGGYETKVHRITDFDLTIDTTSKGY